MRQPTIPVPRHISDPEHYRTMVRTCVEVRSLIPFLEHNTQGMAEAAELIDDLVEEASRLGAMTHFINVVMNLDGVQFVDTFDNEDEN